MVNRCGRQDNIEFEQTPDPSSPKLRNGEHTKFVLTLSCRECGESANLSSMEPKRCQWWINIFRMKHASCHMEVSEAWK